MKYLLITFLVLKIVQIQVQASMREKRQGLLGQLYQPYYYNLPTFTYSPPPTAAAELRSMGDVEGADVKGRIMFTQTAGGVVFMWGNITGLTPGAHGFHVHEFGDTREGCKSMGAHFNPGLVNHGGPADPYRHVGDLGNVIADADGVAKLQESDHFIALAGPNSIVGRGLVVHMNKDDFGRGGDKESLRTGNAGGRVACGIISWVKPEAPFVRPYPAAGSGASSSESVEQTDSPEK